MLSPLAMEEADVHRPLGAGARTDEDPSRLCSLPSSATTAAAPGRHPHPAPLSLLPSFAFSLSLSSPCFLSLAGNTRTQELHAMAAPWCFVQRLSCSFRWPQLRVPRQRSSAKSPCSRRHVTRVAPRPSSPGSHRCPNSPPSLPLQVEQQQLEPLAHVDRIASAWATASPAPVPCTAQQRE